MRRWRHRRCELRRDSAHRWELVWGRDARYCTRCGVQVDTLDLWDYLRWLYGRGWDHTAVKDARLWDQYAARQFFREAS